MVLEGGTGFSGAFARQVTLNATAIDQELTTDLLDALEVSSAEGGVVLEGEGVFIDQQESTPIELQFDPEFQGGVYVSKARDRACFGRKELVTLAKDGKFVGTFTGRHGENADMDTPQPALWTLGTIHEQRGRQVFPVLYDGNQTMRLSGRNFDDYAIVYVDGRRVRASIEVTQDEQEQVLIELDELPETGMHTLQVQVEHGWFSNDFIFHVTQDADAARELDRTFAEALLGARDALASAIARGDAEAVKRRLDGRSPLVNERQPSSGSTPLSAAALFGRTEIADLLLRRGAKVDGTNRDGNTSLHVAAFLCRHDIVHLLLENGASPTAKNKRGETPVDGVSGTWNEGLKDFYKSVAASAEIDLDLDRIQQDRSRIAQILADGVSSSQPTESR